MTATVLVVNAGSSSLKLRIVGPGDEVLASRDEPASMSSRAALSGFLDEAPKLDVAGHRVVHGGEEFSEATRIDAKSEAQVRALADLAPLHNPPALRMIDALRELRPQLPAFACFDTSFHRGMPAAAHTYALPAVWTERWRLRRYGFHGLSHAYASRRAAKLLGRPIGELRLITAHLGAGASLAAIAGGRSIDTTMGFTPLEGLVMATRSGSVDPGLLLWVQRQAGVGPGETEAALEGEAGLLGLSGRTSDLAELIDSAADDESAELAVDVYLHRLRAGIGAMAAALGGVDALVFTGGVGENSAEVRSRAVGGLRFLGLAIDDERNVAPDPDRDIGAAGAAAHTLVVQAREDLEIAAQVRDALRR